MVWLLAFLLGVVIGLNSSVLVVVLVAAVLGLGIAVNTVLSGMGLLQLPWELIMAALSFNLGLVVGLAGALMFRRR